MGFEFDGNGVNTEIDSPATGDSNESTGESSVARLVRLAQRGDRAAWETLIHRFNPLVVSVIRSYRLSYDDSQDVSQTVWLLLHENIARLREPRALPGWIRTTARNEALHQVTRAGRTQPMDPSTLALLPNQHDDSDVDGNLLRFERDRVIRDGLTEMGPRQRELLLLLHAEAKPSYREVGRALGMPTGSIGPTRARYLRKLRNSRAVSAFLLADNEQELVAVG